MAESDRILIWYAPLAETGYFVPYRVLLTTSMGDLSMVLTRLERLTPLVARRVQGVRLLSQSAGRGLRFVPPPSTRRVSFRHVNNCFANGAPRKAPMGCGVDPLMPQKIFCLQRFTSPSDSADSSAN